MNNEHTLTPTCTISHEADGIFSDKGNGTSVVYHLFPEYEVHANRIEPGTVQGWHHHLRITETIFIVAGSLEARWLEDDGRQNSTSLDAGDLIDVGGTVHTFANVSDLECRFLVFRFVPDGSDKRELIKSDRYADVVDA